MQKAMELLERVLPGHGQAFLMEMIESNAGRDVFEVDRTENQIVLRGSNTISLCMALHWYLKYVAQVHVSWCGSRMELPERLPLPEQKYNQIVEQKYRSYMNYCTFNYSASWWDFKRWEQEIDFMALCGVNLPLCTVGLEGVWQAALLELGFTEQETREFLSGPAFLAWQWMTNVEGFCGPLPQNWIDSHVALGQKIMHRMRELGMQPIQQGFSGYVPRKMKEKFPNARIQLQVDWCGLPGTAQLDPTDPLFQKAGRIFLEKQQELFGAYGYYAADPFHEGAPPEDTADYLNAVGRASHKLLKQFDKNAVWVMQSWSIRKEIAAVVPKEDLLILDLAGYKHEQTDYFWGYPFVTGNLHNFGGRTNLHGDMPRLAENQFCQIKKKADNVCGTGLFMEGIMQNPAYYDLAFEMLTYPGARNLDEWVQGYIRRRYGKSCACWTSAWDILLKTVYAPETNGVERSSMICARPALDVQKSGPNEGFLVPYGNKRLRYALNLLLEMESDADGYWYDAADLLRQALSNYAQTLQRKTAQAFKNREQTVFDASARAFLELLEDVDALLDGRPEFSLEKWIREARWWGQSEAEQNLYEWNASVLLTLWGGEEDPHIFDYAWREWSGLIDGFYKVRWEKFFDFLRGHLQAGTEYNGMGIRQVHGREAFRATPFYEELADFETAWTRKRKTFPQEKRGGRETVRRLLHKYENIIA